ncbi:MAG TPA: serine hydrolase [Bacteroidales bacterium]|nr:serine hydrolase [Bacteroidales bacterium]
MIQKNLEKVMDYRYLKIFSLLSLSFIVVVITISIRLDLFGAIKVKTEEEHVSSNAKKEIAKIFYQDKAQKIDSIMQISTKQYYFNGNVLVAYKGNCIYNESFGYADMSRRTKLEKDDIFQLASVSKQFTAMAVMILKEKNLLNYDDSVTKFIPEFPYPRITIRMLLNHTSGLPNYYWLVEHHWHEKKSPVNEDIIKMLAAHKLNLYFTPGRRWNYSNTGYVVLASIVERITEKDFADFVHENIFEPLKMNNSFVYSSSSVSIKKDHLTGYYYRGRRYRMIPETVNDGAVGDKGVYSTTEDLFKWDQALYHNKLVSSETFNEAISTFKLRDKYEIPYGFGFRIRERNDKKIAYHHGKWNGFRTSLLRYVEDTNTVIVLNHTSSSLNYSIIREIQQVLDDSTHVDITQKVVSSILDDGIEFAVKYYFDQTNGKNIKLDTVKISEASQILYDTNNPANAEKLILFKKMYLNGELDTNFMNDITFLKAVSIK